MKNIILILFPIMCFGQVGIFTNTPEAALHIDGADSEVMIDGLNEDNNPINLGEESNTRVFANADGDLVLGENIRNMTFIMDNANYIPDGDEFKVVQTGVGENFTYLVKPGITYPTFTLVQDAIIEINYSLSWRVERTQGKNIKDKIARIIKTTVFIRNNATNTYLPGTYALTGQFYANDDENRGADRWLFNTASDYVFLPAGTYTIIFGGLIQAGGNHNVFSYFGGDKDQLQIIAYY